MRIPEADLEKIDDIVKQLKNIHGCQLVINGIIPTLKYYLRLIENTSAFLDHYIELLSTDKAVLFEHKEMWNKLISYL